MGDKIRNFISTAVMARLVVTCTLTLLSTQHSIAVAQAAAFVPSITVLRDDIAYEVNIDGTYGVEETASYQINTDLGVKQRSQLALTYSTSLQELEVLEAFTTTKDGQRLDVSRDKILVQQSPQSASAPMFDDAKVKTVIFPGVEIGAVLNFRLKRTQRKALFPGQFSMLEDAPAQYGYKSMHVTVRAPAALKLYAEAVDMPGGPVASEEAGVQIWRWGIEDVPARSPELGSVGADDYSPRVAVTTFPDFEAGAVAYGKRAKPKALVTPEIQKLADEITAGVTGRREQAEAIYRWVSTKVRYVAIFLDFGGVVPHEAAAIAEAKYGDCKDHTTLIEALLAAKRIKSSPVLVNLTLTYWLPKVAIMPGVFNHAITYIPEFNLYLDSTASVAMFGSLPTTLYGKRALMIDAGGGKPELVTLPMAGPVRDSVSVNTKLTMTADGSAEGKSAIGNQGVFDLVARQLFSSIPEGMEPQVAARVLTLTGQNGTGTYNHSDIQDLATPFSYSAEFKLPEYAQFPGPGAMAIPTGLSSVSDIAAAV